MKELISASWASWWSSGRSSNSINAASPGQAGDGGVRRSQRFDALLPRAGAAPRRGLPVELAPGGPARDLGRGVLAALRPAPVRAREARVLVPQALQSLPVLGALPAGDCP